MVPKTENLQKLPWALKGLKRWKPSIELIFLQHLLPHCTCTKDAVNVNTFYFPFPKTTGRSSRMLECVQSSLLWPTINCSSHGTSSPPEVELAQFSHPVEANEPENEQCPSLTSRDCSAVGVTYLLATPMILHNSKSQSRRYKKVSYFMLCNKFDFHSLKTLKILKNSKRY